MATINEKLLFEIQVQQKELVDYQNNIKQLRNEQKQLENSFKQGTVTNIEYDKQMQKLNAELNVNKDALQKTTKEYKLNKQIVESVDGSYNQLSAQYRKNLAIVKEFPSDYSKMTQAQKDFYNETEKLNSELKNFDKGLGNSQRNVGNYWGSIKDGITTFAAVGTGIYGAYKAFSEFTQGIRENQKIANALKITLGSTNDEFLNQTILLKNINDIYGHDYNEVLKSANVLSKQMGISGSEALNLINEGFNKGADANGEFLDVLKEYPAQFKSAGLSAKETIAIITQQVNSGVFSDKGIDAIKEGTLRLREMTTSTQTALKAIGLDSVKLQDELKKGTITYFDAIQLVSKKLETLPPQSKEVGQAIADIFGGAGEDVGLQYLITLGDINKELVNVKDNSTEAEKASRNLASAWNTFTTSISNGEGIIGNFLTDINNVFTSVITDLTNFSKYGLKATYEYSKLVTEVVKQGGGGVNEMLDAFNAKIADVNSQIIRAGRSGNTQLKNELMADNKLITDQIGIFFNVLKSQSYEFTKEQTEFFARFGLIKIESEKHVEKTIIESQKKTIIEYIAMLKRSEILLQQSVDNKAAIIEAGAKRELQIEKDKQKEIEQYAERYAAQNNANIQKRIDLYKLEQQEAMQITSDGLAAIASLFDEQTTAYKALMITKALIDTYVAANAAMSQTIGGIGIKIAAASVAVLAGLANVAKIQGFADGGIITSGQPITRSNGDNVLITAKTGEVILNKRQQSLIGTNNLAMAGVPGFAGGGIVNNNMQVRTVVEKQPVLVVRDLNNLQKKMFNEVNLSTF